MIRVLTPIVSKNLSFEFGLGPSIALSLPVFLIPRPILLVVNNFIKLTLSERFPFLLVGRRKLELRNHQDMVS